MVLTTSLCRTAAALAVAAAHLLPTLLHQNVPSLHSNAQQQTDKWLCGALWCGSPAGINLITHIDRASLSRCVKYVVEKGVATLVTP
jgi:hypothetical protein